MIFADYLDLARQRGGYPTDGRLCFALGMTSSSLSQLRNGKILPSDHTLLRVAEIAGIPAEQALMDLQRWRHPEGPARAAWDRVASIVQRNLAPIVLIGCFLPIFDTEARTYSEQSNPYSLDKIYYVK